MPHLLENAININNLPLETLKMEKRKTRVGPWKNVAEFQQVYNDLFGNIEAMKRALSQMRVWSMRRSSLCPAAVLATSVIIDVQLKDAEQTNTNVDLQTLYASAFTRFFNYMSSIMQLHNQRTMYNTARELGLASFVVDLRHICAHGQVLPPLDVLRNASNYCVNWLLDYYWQPQYNSMSDVDASGIRRKDKTQFDEQVTRLFGIYDLALECHMNRRRIVEKHFLELKNYCSQQNVLDVRHVFDVIVKELGALLRQDVGIKDLSEICIEAVMKMDYFFSVSELQNDAEKFELLIGATQSLFRLLATYGLIEDFFHCLLDTAENSVCKLERRAAAGFWAAEIAAAFIAFRKCKQIYKARMEQHADFEELDFTTLNHEIQSNKMRQLLTDAGVDMKCTLIFGDSFRRPWLWVFSRQFIEERLEAANEFTALVLKRLIPLVEPALNEENSLALELLVDTFFAKSSKLKPNKNKIAKEINSDDIHTFNDLVAHINEKDDVDMEIDDLNLSNRDETQFGIWSKATDSEWASCPLGRLPWKE